MDEFGLIEAIRERLARAGAPKASPGLVLASGDDASIAERSGAIAVSVDALVEGVHFELGPFGAADVGAKALAVALSDLAAMGAAPRDAYVQVGLPEGFGEERTLEIADGIGAVAAEHAVAVAGGDLTGSPALFVAVTVIGAARTAGELVTRAGAKPGDVLAVTGALGGAASGLELLRRPELAADLGEPVADSLRRRQLRPVPLIEAGRALARAGVSAMLDVSDGLAGDARRLAERSGVAIMIEEAAVPLAPGVAETARLAGVEPSSLALAGGEDYELLVAVAPEGLETARAAVEELDLRLSPIGSVTKGEGVEVSGSGGRAPGPPGYDHLAPN